jgi:2-polyprenyl-3-methyl-5-hydroxy-6-metoxy-1,4-benzoquinol methylase
VNPSEEAAARARLSGGMSHAAIYAMVRRALAGRQPGGVVVDVGCGHAHLRDELDGLFDRYIGVDVVVYAASSAHQSLVLADVERGLPLRDNVADVAIAVETIEHLENPRAFVRELARVVRPNGTVVITTPNQLSALSLLSLVVKRRFAAFQDVHYPAHRTALLEVDLRRIVAEAGLVEPRIHFSEHSRVPLTAVAYPRWIARRAPALFSDNVLINAQKRGLGR